MKKVAILPGQVFGRWKVISDCPAQSGARHVRCLCACGSISDVRLQHLRSGRSASCGCIRSELTSTRMKTHGDTGTPLHNIWRGMLQRCQNPRNKDFPRYGGRRISVCSGWQEFENFKADMQLGFLPGMEIDRRDNNGNYEPSNCRWTNSKVNSRNQEKTVRVQWEGSTFALCDLAERYGHPTKRVYQRYVTYGWTLERALMEAA